MNKEFDRRGLEILREFLPNCEFEKNDEKRRRGNFWIWTYETSKVFHSRNRCDGGLKILLLTSC
jgi:hypothetical protein